MKYRACVAGAALVMHAVAGGAQSATPHVSAPLVVSATRLEERSPIAASVTVISAEEIARGPAKSLPELLALQAGVLRRTLFGNYGARDNVDIRGFGATAGQNTLILLDGRRLNDVDLAAVDFPAIALNVIDRIEITRGGGAVLYGDGAVGGTVNIITKSPVTLGARASAGASVASYDTRGARAEVTHGLGAFGIHLFANHLRSDGYRQNNDLQQTNVLADMLWTSGRREWFVKLRGDNQALGLPGPRLVDPGAGIDELKADRRGTNTPDDFADQTGAAVSAGLVAFFSDDDHVALDAGVRDKHQEAFLQGGYLDTELATWSFTPRFVVHHTPLGARARSILGIDFYRSDYDSDRSASRETVATPIHRLSIDQDSLSLYAQTTHSLTEATSVVAGARLQRLEIQGTDVFDPTAPGAAFESEAPDFYQTRREPSYELGVREQLSAALSIYARFERSARFATVDELFEFDPTSFQRVFSPLEPQTARTLDVGADYARGGRQLSASAYHMRLRDEIHFNPLTFTNDNLDPTRRYGVALSAEDRLAGPVRGTLDYAYTRAEFREGAFAGNEVPLVPRHTAAVSVIWRLSPGATFSATAQYTGSKRFDNDQTNTFERIPSYTLVDLKYASRLGRFDWDISVFNVFDKEVFDYGVRSPATPGRFNAYPLPGRNYALTVNRQF